LYLTAKILLEAGAIFTLVFNHAQKTLVLALSGFAQPYWRGFRNLGVFG
jgi:hypothetical protein